MAGYADEFTALVRKVRTELNNVAPGYQLTFDTMGSIGNQPIAERDRPGRRRRGLHHGLRLPDAGSSPTPARSLRSPARSTTSPTRSRRTRRRSRRRRSSWGSRTTAGPGRPRPTRCTPGPSRRRSTADPPRRSMPMRSPSRTPMAGAGTPSSSRPGRPTASRRAPPRTAASRRGAQLYYDDATSLKRRYDLVNRRQPPRRRDLGARLRRTVGRAAQRPSPTSSSPTGRRPSSASATLASTQRDEGFRVAWRSWDDSPISSYDVRRLDRRGGLDAVARRART